MMDRYHQAYIRLYNVAGLRTTEVASMLGIHRVTASRWKSEGINCDRQTLKRLNNLLKLVEKAIAARDLPLDSDSVKGKNERLSAINLILRSHMRR